MLDTLTYSVVVPVFNSEGSLRILCDSIIASLTGRSFEIIFVDDNSSDRSWQQLLQFTKEHPSIVKCIQLQKNYGQHAATLCGLTFCRGEYVVTIDDDLQNAPADICVLIEKQQAVGAAVVYGVSSQRKQSVFRNLGARYVQMETIVFEGVERRASSFRLMNAQMVKNIVQHHTDSFVSLDNILKWYTSDFGFVEVTHHERKAGKSGYSFSALVRLYLGGMAFYSLVPLRVMTYFAGGLASFFLLLSIRFIIIKMMRNVPMGYTSVIVAVFFCASMIMFYLGVIGQYLFRMYASQQKKPLYSIKCVTNDN